MSKYQTDQEAFWANEFGDEYSKRNTGENWVACNTALFTEIFRHVLSIKSVIEFGSNIGLNLHAIRHLQPNAELSAIEINDTAVEELKKWNCPGLRIYPCSIFDFKVDYQRDFSFTKGVLIHLNPDFLPQAYRLLYETSRKYICIAEYYNPSPITIPYRGNTERLFKRDFAGEIIDMFPDLTLIDYGFVYHRDNNFPQDDLTWFLFEKKNS